MTITFFSNFLNHHQLPLCLEFQKKLGSNFRFVATAPITEERLALGYDDMNSLYDFVVKSYENEEEAYRLAVNSDIVIIGSAPNKYVKERIKKNKITFWYSERIFKEGFSLKKWLGIIKNYALIGNNKYLLCSSAYTANDFNISFSFKNRCFKWGYFPKTFDYDIDKLINKKNNNSKTELLWVGRFLDWKHPEKVVEIAKRLKNDNVDFSIKMIGIGPMFEEIKNKIEENNLTDYIKLTGAINNKEVRKYMEEANIYLFTSDYNEGWGAVLNEAMNSGCAVIASHAIGSVPFLIKNNKNGLVYKDESIDDLYDKVKYLINNKELQNKVGKNAYNTITKYWNAEYAVNEFLLLVEKVLLNKKIKYNNKNIPCAIAEAIPQNKMYDYVTEKNND